MKKVVFYQIVSVIFLIIIVILFTTMWRGRNQHPPFKGSANNPSSKVIERLNFDSLQVIQYMELIEGYRKQIRTLDQQINASKKMLYQGLNDTNSAKDDSLIISIGEKQMQIEQLHLIHFREIKKICRSDQMEEYNELKEELAKLFGRKRPKRRPKPHPRNY